MELPQLIAALSDPAVYPEPTRQVEVRQTHISVVFLAGRYAYKVKKPVALGFLDFRSLDDRKRFCEAEVKLNHRLAPAVYRGVVPVAREGSGVRVGGPGEIVEWAVQMERLPDDATLLRRLGRGEVRPGWLESLAGRVAAFHAAARSGPEVAAFGRFEVVAGNARENFTQAAAQVGTTLTPALHDRLRARTEEALARLRPLIESRVARGVPRETHGDLHLDHVYVFPEQPPPDDLVIIDCIEFNERFRFADPVADAAFLVMDLRFHRRDDLARVFADAYFRAAGDDEGRELLPFYSAYRAAVRGKVEGITAAEGEVPDAERAAARERARAHWLLALGELEGPASRPCLVLVGGLPGTGKSTLARGLAGRGGLEVLRTDVVRKELAGGSAGEALYTPERTERTYAECLRRADALLADGKRVAVDATFREDRRRRDFLALAERWRVPAVFLLCRAAPATALARLAARRGDASDAGPAVYADLAGRWEAPGPATRPYTHEIATDGRAEDATADAVSVLRRLGVCG